MAAPRLVLASRSPQRRVILEQLGVAFRAVAPDVDEVSGGDPRAHVVGNALRKAHAVRPKVAPEEPVLGVDTAVVLDGAIHGKPPDEAAARAVLAALAGRSHEVWSGIALLGPGERESASAAVTKVRFRRLEAAELDWYLASGEWRGRAGGYAIQGRGAALVEAIAGDYFNVVGLPVAELVRLAPAIARD